MTWIVCRLFLNLVTSLQIKKDRAIIVVQLMMMMMMMIIIIIIFLAHQHKACGQLKIKQEMTAVGD